MNEKGLGYSIALLREQAGFTQAELARRMKENQQISPAGVSRIESGDREVSEVEIEAIVTSIGTEEALNFLSFYTTKWQFLNKPNFEHADREVLQKIDETLQVVASFYQLPDLKAAYRKQLERYESQLVKIAAQLERQDHSLAMIGSIGAGKSTAICKMTGLETPTEGREGQLEPVLEVGGGGTTICEVRVKQGPEFGMIIEPLSYESIKEDVEDFCNYLMPDSRGSHQIEIDSEGVGISKEVLRAIRNMASLPIKKSKTSEGKWLRHDVAKELAVEIGDPKELLFQILRRMDLPRRDRRDIWFPIGSSETPLAWLRDTFKEINNGRHRDFSIPRRIEVITPFPLLVEQGETNSLNITIVDTKGIDQTAGRSDLEFHFDEAHTLVVLCSTFNDAPQAAIQQLLQRAKDSGIQNIERKTILMVFPKSGEAMAMKDDITGDGVGDDEEGYEIKREQVEMRLDHLGVPSIPVTFFNALQEDPHVLRGVLLRSLDSLREHFRDQAYALMKTIAQLVENRDKEEYQATLRSAGDRLKVWLVDNREISSIPAEVHEALLETIKSAHPRTILASVRRRGLWPNLEYSHELGFGARKVAANIVEGSLRDFKVIAKNLLNDPELNDAHDFVRQVALSLETATEDMLRRIQETGRSAFVSELSSSDLWRQCRDESGIGYRNRVVDLNSKWFADENVVLIRTFIVEQIEKGWKRITDDLEQMLTTELNIE